MTSFQTSTPPPFNPNLSNNSYLNDTTHQQNEDHIDPSIVHQNMINPQTNDNKDKHNDNENHNDNDKDNISYPKLGTKSNRIAPITNLNNHPNEQKNDDKNHNNDNNDNNANQTENNTQYPQLSQHSTIFNNNTNIATFCVLDIKPSYQTVSMSLLYQLFNAWLQNHPKLQNIAIFNTQIIETQFPDNNLWVTTTTANTNYCCCCYNNNNNNSNIYHIRFLRVTYWYHQDTLDTNNSNNKDFILKKHEIIYTHGNDPPSKDAFYQTTPQSNKCIIL